MRRRQAPAAPSTAPPMAYSISSSFPYVSPEWLVHQTPQSAQIKLRYASEDSSQRGVWHVSPLGLEALKLCTGERTLEEALVEASTRFQGDGFSAVESIAAFLTDAMKLGVLAFQAFVRQCRA
jgi:hypothetical protein